MKKKYKNLGLLLLAVGVMGTPAGQVLATSTTVGATSTFLAAISLTPTDMAFGKITYSQAPASGDTVTLSTAGALTFAGPAFASAGGTVSAGNIAITGTTSQVMTVNCSASGTLAQASGSGRIALNTIKVADVAGTGTCSNSCTCNGTGNTVLTFTYTSGTNNAVKVGGRIDGATTTSFAAGSYSTTNTGGTGITVNIVYQ
jgi:hypothetical protein